jgi:hypothetical protein
MPATGIVAPLLSALHVLALGIGLGSVFIDRLPRLVPVNDLETALVVLIPFAAAAMARGMWLY